MINMKALIVVLLFTSSIVDASTISYTESGVASGAVSVTQQWVGQSSGSQLLTTQVSLPQFDPSLGTLNQVDFSFSMSGTFDTTVTKMPLPYGWNTDALIGDTTSTLNEGYSFNVGSISDSFSLSNTTFSGTFWIGDPLRSVISASQSPSPTHSNSFTLNLSGFVGTTSFDVTLSNELDLMLNVHDFGGDYAVTEGDLGGSSSGVASVTYSFTPVPEPATITLVGISLVGLLYIIRRRS